MEFIELVKVALTSDSLAYFVIIILFYILTSTLKKITDNLITISTNIALLEDNIKDIQNGNIKKKGK